MTIMAIAWRLLCYSLAVALTYYLASFIQASLHVLLGHKKIGGILYTAHVYHHHAHYSKDRMVSERYLPEELDAAPFFVVPVLLVGWGAYELLPFDLFLVHSLTMWFCFALHIYLHKHYHLNHSWLGRFAWFRAKQQLHFVHHRHASKNYALIGTCWDHLFGTYQRVGADGPQGES